MSNPQMPTMARAELELKPRAGNANKISHMGGRNPITYAISAASQGLH